MASRHGRNLLDAGSGLDLAQDLVSDAAMGNAGETLPLRAVRHAELETTAFDCAPLRVRRVRGTEAIGQPFEFRVELVAVDEHRAEPLLDPADMVGASCALVLRSEEGAALRTVHGIAAEVRLAASDEAARFGAYELVLVPRLWRTSLVATQEIFLDASVVEVIETKLARHGLDAAARFSLLGKYPVREFWVQYKESDLAFIQRLCENAGISFYFEEAAGEERVVFCDHEAGFGVVTSAGAGAAGGPPLVPYAARGERSGVYELDTTCRLAPARFAVSDYNYRIPDVDISAVGEASGPSYGGVVEYGAHHKSADEGVLLASVRVEESQAARRFHVARTSVSELAAGHRLLLDGHPRLEETPLLVVDARHELTLPVGGEAAATSRYECELRLVASRPTYRPPRITPRPRIHGVVTGMVQPGPGGETGGVARLDDEGRYTVQFHFDTTDYDGLKASRPLRMAQPFLGSNHGMHFPLRPGAEVLLAFVDGDPDRPVILGAVPNAVNRSPSVARNANANRITTASGVLLEITDGR